MKTRWQNIFSSSLLFGCFLLLWQALAQSPQMRFFFGSPSEVVESLTHSLFHGTLLADFFVTGFEVVLGFVLGIGAGVMTSFVLWRFPLVFRLTRPYLLIAGSIPIVAFAPLVIIWLGIGSPMKILLAAMGVFFITTDQALAGAFAASKTIIHITYLFGASPRQIFHKIILPSASLRVIESLRSSIGLSILGAFIGEFISSQAGLGHFVIRAGSLYDIPSVFAGGFLLVCLAFSLNALVSVVVKNQRVLLVAISS